jgi:hypothetical protein
MNVYLDPSVDAVPSCESSEYCYQVSVWDARKIVQGSGRDMRSALRTGGYVLFAKIPRNK